MAEVSYRVDDFDGKTRVTGDATYVALNGSAVLIDLSPKHTEELAALLAPYFEKGTEVTVRTARTSGTSTVNEVLTGKAALADTEEIRSWGRDNGFEVSDKGRLSRKLLEAFNTAVNADENAADVDA